MRRGSSSSSGGDVRRREREERQRGRSDRGITTLGEVVRKTKADGGFAGRASAALPMSDVKPSSTRSAIKSNAQLQRPSATTGSSSVRSVTAIRKPLASLLRQFGREGASGQKIARHCAPCPSDRSFTHRFTFIELVL